VNDEDDVFDELPRDAPPSNTPSDELAATLGPGPYDFDDVMRLHYDPGDYAKHVRALEKRHRVVRNANLLKQTHQRPSCRSPSGGDRWTPFTPSSD
jgi:hypothetical protein